MAFVACLLVLVCLASSVGDGKAPRDTTEVVNEGDDAILTCSLSLNLEKKVFDWKKGHLEVFFYDAGAYYDHPNVQFRREGQDKQFEGRVSHFQEELKNGNASIIIRNTKVDDSGNYTCVFPKLTPERFTVRLVVKPVRKDRTSENIPGLAPKLSTMILDATERGVPLKCEVYGASPKPELEWQDSEGNVLPAEEPRVSESRGAYNVTLTTFVNKNRTNRFRCVATQNTSNHETAHEIYVPEKMFEQPKAVWIAVGILVGFIFGVWLTPALTFTVKGYRILKRKTDSSQQRAACNARNNWWIKCKRLLSPRPTFTAQMETKESVTVHLTGNKPAE